MTGFTNHIVTVYCPISTFCMYLFLNKINKTENSPPAAEGPVEKHYGGLEIQQETGNQQWYAGNLTF